MAFHLPWPNRLAASWRRGKAASPDLGLSRKSPEIATKADETLHVGRAEIDLASDHVRASDGTDTLLRRQSADVLRVLAARRGCTVSKEDLFREVWPNVAVTDDSLVQCVIDIRRALGEDGRRLLQTVPKRGYRLAWDEDQPQVAREGAADGRRSRTRFGRRLAAVLAAMVLLAGAAWTLRPSGAAELPSIMVLPFADLTGDPRWERLGGGIATDLAADLSRSRGFVVVASASGNSDDPPAGAGGWDARYVLDGTLQAEGGDLRVTARLTEAESGEVLWSDRWERPAADVFAVQDDILGRVGGTLDGTWTGLVARLARAGLADRGTRDLDAYELHLLGAEAKHRFTPEGDADAIAYFERAIEADPGFAKAYVSLTIVLWSQFASAATEEEAAALFDRAKALAETAVELDPSDPDALIQLASVRVTEGRRAEAWPILERAVGLAPNNPDVLTVAAWNYPWADQDQSPLDWAKRAVELNPGHPDYYNVGLGLAALFAGEFELARQAAREAPPVPEAWITLAAAEALLGDAEAGRAAFERFAAETSLDRFGRLFGTTDMTRDPAWANLVEGVRLASVPIHSIEAEAAR